MKTENEKIANSFALIKSFFDARTSNKMHIKNAKSEIVDSQIFSDKDINTFIDMALTAFNSVAPTSNVSLADELVIKKCSVFIVRYAVAEAFKAKALQEKGREHVYSSDDVSFSSHGLADMLFEQAKHEMVNWSSEVTSYKISTNFQDMLK